MKARQPSKPRESQPAPGRFFHLTYSNSAPDDVPKLFQGRDGTAFVFEHSGPSHPLGVALIQKHLSLPKKVQRGTNSTVAFLFRADSLPGVDNTPSLPCALLASFGMDGYSTLIWNTIVRFKYPHLVARPGFVMAELIFKQPIPDRPLTPEFALDPAFMEVRLLTRT